ncbi:hypothetical protein BDZ45DRAFT_30955 [Acephala macrosclerotiorum]|nr:hypothetical protein BDZ45DRAFT_30955 [Acephala macrosclerotiorum]
MRQDTHQPSQNMTDSTSHIMGQDTMMSEGSTTSQSPQQSQPRTRRRPGFLTKEERRRLSRPGRRAYLDRLFSTDFPGKVTIDFDPETALSIASSEYSSNETTTDGGRMVLWTDACTNGAGGGSFGKSGIGIVYRRALSRWITMPYHIRRPVPTWGAEMAAIAQAIKIAEEEAVMREARPSIVVVYFDCLKALLRYHDGDLKTVPCRGSLLKSGVAAAHNLKQLGIEVELRWAPGHWNTESQQHIKGNVLAHSAARKAARSTPPEGTENLVEMRMDPRKKKRAPVAIFKVMGDGGPQCEIENGMEKLAIV